MVMWHMAEDPGPAEPTTTAAVRPPAKVRATFHLPADLLDEARNAVVALSGPPHRLTLAKLAENALRAEIDRLKQLQTGRHTGQPFPQRDGDVRSGRPIGS